MSSNDGPANLGDDHDPDGPDLASFDTGVAHPARVYNYWLGGKDNYEADREAAEHAVAANPNILPGVRANRAFLRRAVEYLADEAGIRQFLDIGTGLPTVENTHEVAQAIAPDSRIVYVDNDPIVLAHARALLTSTAEGATAYVDADARDTDTILAEAAKILDFSQPIAVMFLMILQYIPDEEQPQQIVAQLMDAMPPGSYLVHSDTTGDIDSERVATATARLNARLGPAQLHRRDPGADGRVFHRPGHGGARAGLPAGMARAGQSRPHDPVLRGCRPQALTSCRNGSTSSTRPGMTSPRR